MKRVRGLLVLALLASCGDDGGSYNGPPFGLVGDNVLFPFPSIQLMEEDASTATGWRVAIPQDLVPMSEAPDAQRLNVSRFNRRDGFSTAQMMVTLIPGQDVDPASLPGQERIADSLGADATVRIYDLADGTRIPLLAEMDANPDATGPANRVLIVRPMKALEFAHHYAVAITTGVTLRGGGNLAPLERFATLRDGRSPHPSLDRWVDHYGEVLDALEGYGLPRAQMALVWDFWTASDESMHAPFNRILEATRADIPAESTFTPTWTIRQVDDISTDPELNAHLLRRVRGTFSIVSYCEQDKAFVLDDDAMPTPVGRRDAPFVALVPATAATAAAGSFGVMVYGHGLLDSPEWPLGSNRDPDRVGRIIDDLQLIAIGTEWSGLAERDEVDAISASVDFSKFPLVTDELQQGVATALALERLVQTEFRNDPNFAAAGGGSLIDPNRIVYYGISLGGIEGTTLVANSQYVRAGVFHVPGGAWTTMLERSSNWDEYDMYMTQWTPEPVDRQVLYALSQMLWDPVDPITHITRMRSKRGLWQESMGDAQVPNIATELLARSIGVPLVQPSVDHPVALTETAAPLPAGSSALVQYDPGCGRPEPVNRPAEDNDAHSVVRRWEETITQIETFLGDGTEGTVIHPCGTAACVSTACSDTGI